MPRTYIHDFEAGRRWPNRAWVERLSALDDAGTSLLERYDSITAQRSASLKRPLGASAKELLDALQGGLPVDDGKDCDPLVLSPGTRLRDATTFQAFSGWTECLEVALELLSTVGAEEPKAVEPGQPGPLGELEDDCFLGTLMIDSPSVERSPLPWVSVLRAALDNKWAVVHLLAPEDDPGRRLDRVRALLSLVDREGAYHPMVHPGRSTDADGGVHQTMEAIVAPGHGVLQLYPAAESASFFPWRDEFAPVCRQIALATYTVQAASVPVVTVYGTGHPTDLPVDDNATEDDRFREELRQLPPKIAFDAAQTTAVSAGRRVLLKPGFLLACMPPQSTVDFSRRVKLRAAKVGMAEYIPLIEVLSNNRRQRRQALRQFPSRDICTLQPIRDYLDPSKGVIQQYDPFSREITFADRLAHVRGVVELLETSQHYEVALVDTPELFPVPVGPGYWMATESALFFVRHSDDGSGTRYVIIRDQAVIEACFQLFDECWDSLAESQRSRKAVIATLKAMIADGEEAHRQMAPVS